MKELYASTIEEGVWRYIDLFSEYYDLRKRTNSTEKASQISFCLRQASEYYQASKQATILTKPVLLYYGMLNLCKALILLKNPGISLQNSLTTHGLRHVSPTSNSSLLALSCRVEKSAKSVFYNLLRAATKDRFTIQTIINSNSAIQDSASDYSKQSLIAVGKNYRISDVVIVIPELFELLLGTTNLCPRIVPISHFSFRQKVDKQERSFTYSAARIIIRHGRYPKIKKLIKSFEKKSELRDWKLKEDRWDVFEYVIPAKVQKFSYPDIRETVFREQFGVFLSRRKFRLSEIVSHFLLMFILGDAARYLPYIWNRLIDKKTSQKALIETFIGISEIKFPLLVLRELRDDLVYFRRT